MVRSTHTLCIDPGSTHSGVVMLNGDTVAWAHNMSNQQVLEQIMAAEHDLLVCESVEYLSSRAGKSLIKTIWWSGAFCWESRRQDREYVLMPRLDVKKILLGKGKWEDKDVRTRVIEIYSEKGQTEKDLLGTRAAPGPLGAVTSHSWQALAAGIAHRIERNVCGLPGVERGTLFEHLESDPGIHQ